MVDLAGYQKIAARSKYRSVKTEVDGIVFASRKEAERYGELKLLLKGGYISHLEMQVPFKVVINGRKICKYVADFIYFENGDRIVEDVKGYKTAIYKLKRKLVEATHNVTIREI